MSWLAERCPRLAKAVADHRAWHRELVRLEAEWASDVLRLERLVAHRELQVSRACSTARGRKGGDYVAVRMRKLAVAQSALARVRRRRPMLA